ncbi:MAG: hypothetical protein RIQ35_970, partial [Pseudomonadota bacterium]
MELLDLIVLLPELVILLSACLLLLLSVFVKETPLAADGMVREVFDTPRGANLVYNGALLLLLVIGTIFALRIPDLPIYAMMGLFQADPLANLLKSASCFALLISLIYSRQYLVDRGMFRPDFIVLALFALLGQCVLISGANLLTLYLGLELMALSTYGLVAMRQDNAQSTEAAMKYFILGALASGFLLYGMSMLYGVTGSLDLIEIFKAVADPRINHLIMAFGLVFIMAGLAFKLGVVPFH